MKKLLLILLYLPMIGFGQNTYVPDDNFEQELINLGYDSALDDSVLTSSIDTVTYLNIDNLFISDATGLEAFVSLIDLNCSYNQLVSIDLSQNTNLTFLNCQANQLSSIDVTQNSVLTHLQCRDNPISSLNVTQNLALTHLICASNQLTSLDVTQNLALTYLRCSYNQITSLNVSHNTALTNLECPNNLMTSLDLSGANALADLWCSYNLLTMLNLTQNLDLYSLACDDNQLTNLDVTQNLALKFLFCVSNQLTSLNLSQNIALTNLQCQNNQLISLDLRNGNNQYINNDFIILSNNPLLTCINVDNISYSTTNWTDIDTQHYFSTNCTPSAIQEHTSDKELLKVTDLFGREIKQTNQPLLYLLYLHNDGTVEKRIVIE